MERKYLGGRPLRQKEQKMGDLRKVGPPCVRYHRKQYSEPGEEGSDEWRRACQPATLVSVDVDDKCRQQNLARERQKDTKNFLS